MWKFPLKTTRTWIGMTCRFEICPISWPEGLGTPDSGDLRHVIDPPPLLMRKQPVVGSAKTCKDLKESTPSDWIGKISRHSLPGANLVIEQIQLQDNPRNYTSTNHPSTIRHFVAQLPYCHEEIYDIPRNFPTLLTGLWVKSSANHTKICKNYPFICRSFFLVFTY